MRVSQLFVKRQHGDDLETATSIDCTQDGIVGNVVCAPFRQALIASQSVRTVA